MASHTYDLNRKQNEKPCMNVYDWVIHAGVQAELSV